MSRKASVPANSVALTRRVPRKRRFAVIMAGGVGSRFWPWSRRKSPKQMLALTASRPMIVETALRVRGMLPDENIIVVTSRDLGPAVSKALPWLPARSLLCEPLGRNTAPCIGWAANEILSREPGGVMAVLAADHLIEPKEQFRRALREAFSLAEASEFLITFGIRPRGPETGYGYIEAGKKLYPESPLRLVKKFHEKPSLVKAKRYVKSSKYYWNSGMFVWKAAVIADELRRYLPEMARGLAGLEQSRRRGRIAAAALDGVYPGLESVSIDYGVLERSDRVAVIPATFEWSDIGSWDAVAALWEGDKLDNLSRDPLLVLDAGRNVVASRGKPVALLGVEDLVVVDSGDALLVCKRDRCQDVKKIVELLEKLEGSGSALRKLL